MKIPRLTLRLTGREADALHELLSVVLNDPDWFDGSDDAVVITQVDDQLMGALRQATK